MRERMREKNFNLKKKTVWPSYGRSQLQLIYIYNIISKIKGD